MYFVAFPKIPIRTYVVSSLANKAFGLWISPLKKLMMKIQSTVNVFCWTPPVRRGEGGGGCCSFDLNLPPQPQLSLYSTTAHTACNRMSSFKNASIMLFPSAAVFYPPSANIICTYTHAILCMHDTFYV